VIDSGVLPRLNAYYPIPGTDLYESLVNCEYITSVNKSHFRGEYAIVETPILSRRILIEFIETFFAFRMAVNILNDYSKVCMGDMVLNGGDDIIFILKSLGLVANNNINSPSFPLIIRIVQCECYPFASIGKSAVMACKHYADRLSRLFGMFDVVSYAVNEKKCRFNGFDENCEFEVIRDIVEDEGRAYILDAFRRILKKVLGFGLESYVAPQSSILSI
jgi:hypothetical protein